MRSQSETRAARAAPVAAPARAPAAGDGALGCPAAGGGGAAWEAVRTLSELIVEFYFVKIVQPARGKTRVPPRRGLPTPKFLDPPPPSLRRALVRQGTHGASAVARRGPRLSERLKRLARYRQNVTHRQEGAPQNGCSAPCAALAFRYTLRCSSPDERATAGVSTTDRSPNASHGVTHDRR